MFLFSVFSGLFFVARGPVPRENPFPFFVARGPVPRNRSTTPMLGGGQAPALRLSGWLLFSVARGPVPRDRLTTPTLGGGQAPALRLFGWLLFFVGRGPVPRNPTIERKARSHLRSARACPSQPFDDPDAWRGTGPRPTFIRVALIFRRARACSSQSYDRKKSPFPSP